MKSHSLTIRLLCTAFAINLFSSALFAADYYWNVDPTGSTGLAWGTGSNWADSVGGTPYGTPPTVSDDVYIQVSPEAVPPANYVQITAQSSITGAGDFGSLTVINDRLDAINNLNVSTGSAINTTGNLTLQGGSWFTANHSVNLGTGNLNIGNGLVSSTSRTFLTAYNLIGNTDVTAGTIHVNGDSDVLQNAVLDMSATTGQTSNVYADVNIDYGGTLMSFSGGDSGTTIFHGGFEVNGNGVLQIGNAIGARQTAVVNSGTSMLNSSYVSMRIFIYEGATFQHNNLILGGASNVSTNGLGFYAQNTATSDAGKLIVDNDMTITDTVKLNMAVADGVDSLIQIGGNLTISGAPHMYANETSSIELAGNYNLETTGFSGGTTLNDFNFVFNGTAIQDIEVASESVGSTDMFTLGTLELADGSILSLVDNNGGQLGSAFKTLALTISGTSTLYLNGYDLWYFDGSWQQISEGLGQSIGGGTLNVYSSIPEPATTTLLFGLGCIAIGWIRRRNAQSKR